jgi:hypothetical protein
MEAATSSNMLITVIRLHIIYYIIIYIKAKVFVGMYSMCVARQWPTHDNEVVFSFGSVLRLYKGGHGLESDSSQFS